MNDHQSTLSRLVRETRYRAEGEADLDATRQRVARALASVEPADRALWAARYRCEDQTSGRTGPWCGSVREGA